MQIEPYLFFDGQCEAALAHYAACLGGHVVALHRYEGSPLADKVPPEWLPRIMHATMEAPGCRFMACDRMPDVIFTGHSGFAMSVNIPKDPKRGELVFGALGLEGQITTPFALTFWGAHFGMLVDKFGVSWMVNCDNDQLINTVHPSVAGSTLAPHTTRQTTSS